MYTQACRLASAALCTQKYEELELAFRGDARSAFIWLQCFIHEEEDWCYTRGCPGTLSILVSVNAHLLSASKANFALGGSSRGIYHASRYPSIDYSNITV